MIEAYLERASTYAGDIDILFSVVFWIVAVWFVAAEGVLFYFCFRYRKQDGLKAKYVTGEKESHKIWISVPHYLIQNGFLRFLRRQYGVCGVNGNKQY